MAQDETFSDEEFVELDEISSVFTDEQTRLTERLGVHLDSKTPSLGVADSTIFLDPEQVNVLRGIYAQLKAKQKSMYVEAPTGFGKTVVILKLLEALTRDGKPPRIMIAVPDIDALETWRNAIEELAPILSKDGKNPFEHIGYYYEGQKDTDKAITIATMASMVITNQNKIFGNDDFDIVIVDEGHSALSDLRVSVLAESEAVRIYLSATPAYTHAKSLDNVAVRAYRCSPEHAEKLKLVSKYQNIIVAQPDIVLDESVLNQSGDINLAELSRRAKTAGVNELLINFYTNEIQPHNQQPFFGTQGIVNCFNVEDALSTAADINKALEGKLPEGVVGAVALHGNTPSDVRIAAKKAYREGKIMMLTGVRLLTHSFHDPRTCFVWNKLPSSSGVQVGQRGGRARSVSRDPAAPSKMAYIIDVLYRNVRLNSWQILYGEYMSGFLNDEGSGKRTAPPKAPVAEDATTPKKPSNKASVFDIELLTAGTVVADPEQVRSLYEQRARLFAELRPPPKWSKAFPTLWTVAKKHGFYNARKMCEVLAENGEQGHNPGKLQNVLSGTVAFYDKDLLEWHPSCMALSRLLKRHVCDLFPITGLDLPATANPDALRRRKNREAFLAILREEGYESLMDFGKRNDISPQRINSIASEGVDNYSAQGWKSDATKIAEVLGMSEETVFGMPAEIREIHDVIGAIAERDGTWSGWRLDPFFAQPIHGDPEEELNQRQMVDAFHDAITKARAEGVLSDRQWNVLQQRYGIGVYEEMTLEEVAVPERVTRERIRQIEIKATRILKQPVRGRHLRSLLNTLDS